MTRSLLVAIMLLAVRSLAAQADATVPVSPADSSAIADTAFREHARNRLLGMSTGEIAEKGSAWFGVHEVVLFQGGFVPADFLQINVMIMPFGSPVALVGAKVQVLPRDGFFRGLAVGGDIGMTLQQNRINDRDLLGAYNIATSFGTDIVAMHLNLTSFNHLEGAGKFGLPNLAQLGISLRYPDDPHIKLMAEAWFVNEDETGKNVDMEFGTVVGGLRIAHKHFVWEVGGFLVSGLSFSGHGPGGEVIVPYASAAWYF